MPDKGAPITAGMSVQHHFYECTHMFEESD